MLKPTDPGWIDINFTDSVLKGVIYSWKNLNADLDGGTLTLRSSVVAYGGNPESDAPGFDNKSGIINIENGSYVNIIHDSTYIGLLPISNRLANLKRLMFNMV